MLSSKQRAGLRTLANTLPDTLLIGKDGITEGVVKQLDELLECHELVKGKLLESSFLTPRGASEELCEQLGAEAVQCIGSKFVLYRKSSDPDKQKIELVK